MVCSDFVLSSVMSVNVSRVAPVSRSRIFSPPVPSLLPHRVFDLKGCAGAKSGRACDGGDSRAGVQG